MPPRFADAMSAPRIASSGRNLPLSRIVSRTMHPDDGFHDHAGTVMVIAWGQFMDHDYTLTATPLGKSPQIPRRPIPVSQVAGNFFALHNLICGKRTELI